MRFKFQSLALATAVSILGAATAGAQAADPSTPKYTNAEVVAVKSTERLLVVRNNEGAEQSYLLDDRVASFGDLRTGDRVILTLRGDPGQQRIESFARAGAVTPTPSPRGLPPATTNVEEVNAAKDALAQRAGVIAAQANRVDRLWGELRTNCTVTIRGGQYDGSREWLSLWSDQAQVDLSNGACRDLYNQVLTQGQAVNTDVAAAEESARRLLEPGQIREILRRNSLDWGRWGSPAPALLENAR
jgi:hypothetical protein